MQLSMIKLHKNMLYLYEHVDFIGNHIKLQIVPSELRNVIFIAFHANPIGSHFDRFLVTRTILEKSSLFNYS
jgi:hypothetical protein